MGVLRRSSANCLTNIFQFFAKNNESTLGHWYPRSKSHYQQSTKQIFWTHHAFLAWKYLHWTVKEKNTKITLTHRANCVYFYSALSSSFTSSKNVHSLKNKKKLLFVIRHIAKKTQLSREISHQLKLHCFNSSAFCFKISHPNINHTQNLYRTYISQSEHYQKLVNL